MSLAAYLLNQAAEVTAREAVRRLGLEEWPASKLAPMALSIFMHGCRRKTRTLLGAASFAILLDRCPEDLLRNERRLSAADIRARGQAFVDCAIGANQMRAVDVLAELADIDRRRAAGVLAMTAAAATSALAKSRRDLKLNTLELRGVVKSEAARIDDADPGLVRQVHEWVFRPAWPQQIWLKAKSAAMRASRARVIIPAE